MTVTSEPSPGVLTIRVADADVAAFLYHEARLLDERRYDEWVDLFADDGLYWIPCNDAGGDPVRSVTIIHEDVAALRSRVGRLTSGKQYAQDPPSRMCRAVSNVYVAADASGGGEATVHSTLLAVEARRHHTKHVFGARCTHVLRRVDGGFRIARKRVDLVDSDQFFENLTFLL